MTKSQSGVPQGSVLGPVCFSVFINDVLADLKTAKGSIFADDTKIYAKVNTREDSLLLQADLDTLDIWGAVDQMSYNAEKCTVVHYGRRNPETTYHLQGQTLKAVVNQKDLGVIFSKDFRFRSHISKKVSESNQTLGIINRTFSYKSIPTMKMLYTSLVRPKVEFCVQAWSPYFRRDVENIETVQ